MSRAPAPAKINLALVVGPLRDDGKHEVLTVLQRIDLVDRIELAEAPELRVDGFADDTLVGEALRALAGSAGLEPRWRVRIEKRIPVAAGLGGGSSDAATALRLANETLPEPLPAERAAQPGRTARSRRPFLPGRRPAARLGRRQRARAARPAAGLLGRRPAPARRGEDLDGRRVRGLRRTEGRARLRRAAPDPARRACRGEAPSGFRGAPAERPRKLAARRGDSRRGRLPRRRLGSRPCAVRALPSPSRRGRRETGARSSGPDLARGTCVVRLTAC